MQPFLPTIVIRHLRENLKKCSLRGLESRRDFQFYSYPRCTLQEAPQYALLAVDAPELSIEDKQMGLLILDGTWRYADKMFDQIPFLKELPRRSLPSHFRTAYPRRQDDCKDPVHGLASIEAIYIAYFLLERPLEGFLDQYYWKNEFLKKNEQYFKG